MHMMCSESVSLTNMISPTFSWNIDRNLSVYIPYVDNSCANEEYFKHVFKSLNIGIVSCVYFRTKQSVYSNTSYGKTATIYMKDWFDNISVEHLQEKILEDNGPEARIVHDDPHYWVLQENKKPVPENYIERLTHLQNEMVKTNKELFTRINFLEQKNLTLETTIAEMQWWIKLHDTNINYLCNKVNSPIVESSPNTNQVTFQTIWENRLRERSNRVNYRDMDETGHT